jgi:N-methylhydantoinase A
VVNENMAAAARMHAIERGRDLRRFSVVATGGAGPVHAWGVAGALGIRTIVFPPGAGVASAFGMLTAAPGLEFARSLPGTLSETRWPEVRRAIAQMTREGALHLRESGVEKGSVEVSVAADVRHRGQGDAVTVELGESLGRAPAEQVEEAFHQTYVALYGRRPPGVEAEVMTWRVRTLGPAPTIDVRADGGADRSPRKGTRRVWFRETGMVEADVMDRYLLRPGAVVRGPAVVEERESTVVIGPGGRGRVEPTGVLVVEVR